MPSAPYAQCPPSPRGCTFTLDPKRMLLPALPRPPPPSGAPALPPGLRGGRTQPLKQTHSRLLSNVQPPWPLARACPGPSHLSSRWDALPWAVHVGPLACRECCPLTGALLTTLSEGTTPGYLLRTRASFLARHHMACLATSSLVEGGARGLCTPRMTAVPMAGSERCVE